MRLKDMITMRKNKCDEDRKNPSFSDFWKGYHEGWYCAYRDLEEILEQKRLDVEIVVRCKNCKHCSDVMEYYADHKENKAHSKPGKACFIGLPKVVYPDDFCSRGERKDGEG